MIDLSNSMLYRINNLNDESERISYQMSSGKVLENGSDDSVLFARYIDIETNLREEVGIKRQIDKSIAQNNVSDNNINELKNTLDMIKQDTLKSLNAGMTRVDKIAVATNLQGMRESLLRIASSSVDGEYIYAGSNTTINPYTKDNDFIINGRVDFHGNAHLRNVAIGDEYYRERGITATDIFMYPTDTSLNDDQITFNERDLIVDQLGYTWKFLEENDSRFTNDGTSTSFDINQYDFIYNNDGNGTNGLNQTFYRAKGDFQNVDLSTEDFSDISKWEAYTPKGQIFQINEDGTVGYDYVDVINDFNNPVTYTSETLTSAEAAGRISEKTLVGLELKTKHNFFDDLNIMINALEGYSTQLQDGPHYGEKLNIIGDEEVRDILSTFTTKLDSQYNATNIGHAELGGRNSFFEDYQERITTKITHYNILIQETNSADLSKLALESKSLELTYTALFSTVSKMNELSLVNFIR